MFHGSYCEAAVWPTVTASSSSGRLHKITINVRAFAHWKKMCDWFDQANANHGWLDRSTEVDMVVISAVSENMDQSLCYQHNLYTLLLFLLLLQWRICTPPRNISDAQHSRSDWGLKKNRDHWRRSPALLGIANSDLILEHFLRGSGMKTKRQCTLVSFLVRWQNELSWRKKWKCNLDDLLLILFISQITAMSLKWKSLSANAFSFSNLTLQIRILVTICWGIFWKLNLKCTFLYHFN